jgi:branched-chain amino acid transport system substrate-binding protein
MFRIRLLTPNTDLPRSSVGRPLWRAGLALLVGVVLAGCRAASAEPPLAGPQVAIATTVDRPGYPSLVRGAELALARVNAERRAGGRAELTLAIPPASARSAVEVAAIWRDNDRVLGVVGHTESGATLDALPIYDDLNGDGAHAVAVLSPTATSPALAGRSPWLFRLSPSDAAVSAALAHYLADTAHTRRAAVIYRNDSYGRDWTHSFRSAFEQQGGVIVARLPYLTGVVEWEAVAALLATRRPDVVLFPGDADAAADCLRALARAGVRARFIGGDGTAALLESSEFPAFEVLAPFQADSSRTAEGRAFIVRYRALHGERPDHFAAAGYDAALVLARAIAATEDAGRLDRRSRRRAVRDFMASLGRARPAIEGTTGPIVFDIAQEISARPMRLLGAAGPAVRARR